MKYFNYTKMMWPTVLFALTLFALPSAAYADGNFLNTITDQYANNMQAWHDPLVGYARQLFWILALLNFVWTAGRLFLTKSDFTDWAQELVVQLIIIGVFYNFLINSTEWSTAIIQSFRLAGNSASGAGGGSVGLQPSDIFNAGVNVCQTIMQAFTLSFDFNKLIEGIALVFGGFIVLISFCLIAALEVVALVESYIFMYAGVIFLGFGGSSFTSDIAKRYFMGLLSVGTKLYMIQLIIGVGQRLIHQWADLVAATNGTLPLQTILQIVGGSVLMLALAKMIPDFSQGLVSGASFGTAGSLFSAGAAAGSVVAAGAMATGAVLTGAVGGAAAGGLAMGAAHHASEAFRHSTGVHISSVTGMGSGKGSRSSQVGHDQTSFRPGGKGRDLPTSYDPNPEARESNTIGK